MGYIYCITNLINGKQYVGKTTNTIEERFKEHCRDSRKERCNKRPLYDAMNKYGVENFKIEELEQIDDPTLLSDREKYWIKELNTWGRTGYNASKGGDGKVLYDYKEIIELYNMGYSQKQVAQKVGCCDGTVSKILKAHNIPIRGGSTKKIDQFDMAGNYVQSFFGSVEVAKWLVEMGLAKSIFSKRHITECCNKKIKSAYGYVWRYAVLP